MDVSDRFDESARLAALHALGLLGDPDVEARFAPFARIAGHALSMPVSLVTMIDEDVQHFSCAIGTDLVEARREDSFCTHAIAEPTPVTVVPDTLADRRFARLPVVVGEPHIRFYAGAPIAAPSGHQIGTLCVLDVEPRDITADDVRTLRDLADLAEKELAHSVVAHSDVLTEVANRRAFEEAAARLLALGVRRSDPVTVLFGDLDELKLANDRHGHAHGDALLRRAAEVMTACTRGTDLVARLGGDEFAILLYDADEREARRVVDAIDGRLGELVDEGSPPLSISFGSATARPDDTLDTLLARADEAMYRAKSARRRIPQR